MRDTSAPLLLVLEQADILECNRACDLIDLDIIRSRIRGIVVWGVKINVGLKGGKKGTYVYNTLKHRCGSRWS